MTFSRPQRIAITLALIAVLLAAAAAVGLHLATRLLKTQVEQALGADSEVAEMVVGWSSIEARGVRIGAPQGWPAPDTLRAARVVVTPDLMALLSSRVQVPRIRIEQAYLSVWRTRDGKLRLLPSLLEHPESSGKAGAAVSASSAGATGAAGSASANSNPAGNASAPDVRIGRIELQDSVLEFFDATVRQPAYKTRLEQLHAVVEDLQVPSMSGRTQIQLDGSIKGVQRSGKLALDGWLELGTKNSELAARLSGIDLLALQPYLIKASETGVKHGTLDMTLKSTVHNNRLKAPGMVTLTGLELNTTGGAFGTFMGLPRKAAVAALKDRNDKITIQFTLEGDLNDPQFSLNDSIAKRIGSAVAETLGISIEGLTRGVGGAVQGFGGVMKKLFSK